VLRKVFAALIRSRLFVHIQEDLPGQQYAYQQGKSTVQPLLLMLHLLEQGQNSKAKLFLLFLEWKHVFDKLTHPTLGKALQKIDLPDKRRSIIMSFYETPKFAIKEAENVTRWYDIRAGVRQGCNLAPLLFIMARSCIRHDAQEHPLKNTDRMPPTRLRNQAIVYADDTLVCATTQKVMQTMISNKERESHKHGMQLNQDKCALL